ncbi:MAG: hypothetical protein IJ562_07260 [Prevotella sp.]|nr:hypothetical protein [Prevotella sp.]
MRLCVSHKQYLLLLLLLVMGGVNNVFGAASNSYRYRTIVTIGTGSGTVYASYVSDEGHSIENQSSSGNTYDATVRSYSNNVTVSLNATADTGYRFLRWEDSEGNIINSTNSSPTAVLTYNTNGASSSYHGGFFGLGRYYEYTTRRSFTFTAYFAEEGTVVAEVASGQEEIGSAVVDAENIVPGEYVRLVASTIGGSELVGWAFDYWELNGEKVSENPEITVTVPTEKVTYIAHFAKADTENYCFIRNKSTGKYLRLSDVNAYTAPTQSNPTSSFNGSFTMQDAEKAISDPGCVFILVGQSDNGGVKNASLICQGKSIGYQSGSVVIDKALRVTPASEGTYTISTIYTEQGNNYSLYFRDNGGTPDMAIATGATSEWEILNLNRATLNQNYFGAAPKASLERDGKFYTTLYTTFPYELQSGKAYYVNSESIKQENEKYIITCKEISGGKVPANQGVIIECDGTDPAGNKILPLAFSSEVPAIDENLLRGHIKLQHGSKTGDGRTLFVLSSVADAGLAFYRLSSGTPMPDNKVYVILNDEQQNAAKNAVFRFGDEAETGIHDVTRDSRNTVDAVFDLQGRKVEKPSRGVYIVNGKKLLIK